MRKLALLAIPALLLTACGKTEIPEELKSLQTEVNSAQVIIDQLDSASSWATYNRVYPYYEHLKTTDFDSTLKEVYIKDLTWLDRYRSAFSKWNSKVRVNRTEIAEASERISNLVHDVEHGMIPMDTAMIYISQERTVVQGYLNDVQSRGNQVLTFGSDVDSMQTRLKEFFPEI